MNLKEEEESTMINVLCLCLTLNGKEKHGGKIIYFISAHHLNYTELND